MRRREDEMKVGMVGLGRMGANMVRRLLGTGHECVAFDVHPQASEDVVEVGATAVRSLAELVARFETSRAIWIMVPAAVVESSVGQLAPLLAKGDTIIDGGNSHYHDDIRRAETLGRSGINYVDVGTSGGVWSDLSGFAGRVSDSGEGCWTLKAAIDEGVPALVLSTALTQRFASRGDEDFANKLLTAMRYQFGGHEEKS
jgi:6-phosphogluconate dehydrogenase